MDYNKLTSYQSVSLILIVIVNHLILDLPNNFIDDCGSGAILNSIYVIFLGFIFCMVLIKLFKNFSNSDLLDISEFLGGKVLKNFIGILFIAYLLFTLSILLRDFAEGLTLTYFPQMPLFIILILFLIPPAISNKMGFKVIIKANSFIVPITLLSFIIVSISTISSFQIQKAFPILGYGSYKTFFVGSSNIFAFSGLGFLYFIAPMLNNKQDFKKITYISFWITSFLLFFSIVSLILSFSFLRFLNELSPIYLLVRATNYGQFFQRPEAIFMFIWILSFIAYLSSLIIFLLYVVKKTIKVKNPNSLSLLICNIIFVIAIIPTSIWQVKYLQSVFYKYLSLILFGVIGLTILILANIKQKKLRRLKPNA
ncbi:MAG: GerAB/ArcD/ProY family transporter [Clostridia bacterium]|nr:GerAB/ArcD/ProY family transporter [Clostridia bacterium]